MCKACAFNDHEEAHVWKTVQEKWTVVAVSIYRRQTEYEEINEVRKEAGPVKVRFGTIYERQDLRRVINDDNLSGNIRRAALVIYYRTGPFRHYSHGRQNIDEYIDALAEGKEMADEIAEGIYRAGRVAFNATFYLASAALFVIADQVLAVLPDEAVY